MEYDFIKLYFTTLHCHNTQLYYFLAKNDKTSLFLKERYDNIKKELTDATSTIARLDQKAATVFSSNSRRNSKVVKTTILNHFVYYYLLMCRSCHFDRALNDKFSIEL